LVKDHLGSRVQGHGFKQIVIPKHSYSYSNSFFYLLDIMAKTGKNKAPETTDCAAKKQKLTEEKN
jgi:hypothetical protein